MRAEQRSIMADTPVEVTVLGQHQDTLLISVRDQVGKLRDITATVLPGKMSLPAPGEKWIISKALGQWTFTARVGLPQPVPEVTGSRADPATLQRLLVALDAAGVIKDSTTV